MICSLIWPSLGSLVYLECWGFVSSIALYGNFGGFALQTAVSANDPCCFSSVHWGFIGKGWGNDWVVVSNMCFLPRSLDMISFDKYFSKGLTPAK